MKKTILYIIISLFLAVCLFACGTSVDRSEEDKEKITIVTTIFPEYDWVMNILGDNPSGTEVVLLLDSGIDLHSFQPTADDILTISDCDLFICIGGESDEWVNDVLNETENTDMIVIRLLDALGDYAKEEEIVEGMQTEEHDHEDEDEHEEEETEYDEHVWLSPKKAVLLVNCISEAVQKIDAGNAGFYRENTRKYVDELNRLDARFREVVSDAPVKIVLFGDRFPFRYLTDDYGLDYYAAFVGCSAESEASFETITFLAKKVDEYSLPAVLTIEGKDHRIAETIVRNTLTKDRKILTMDSMQSTTSNDIENGTTYISVMEKNLNVLKEALN